MVHYRNPQTRKFILISLLAALLICPFVGLDNIMMWDAVLHKTQALDETILLSVFSFFVLLCVMVPILVQCPSIVANDRGLVVTSCIFIQFTILWEEIIDIWEYDAQSRVGKAQGGVHNSHVRIKKGLTPMHRSLPRKEEGHWQWLRGFMFASASNEYNDLVRAIEAHTGPRKKLSTFYKP